MPVNPNRHQALLEPHEDSGRMDLTLWNRTSRPATFEVQGAKIVKTVRLDGNGRHSSVLVAEEPTIRVYHEGRLLAEADVVEINSVLRLGRVKPLTIEAKED